MIAGCRFSLVLIHDFPGVPKEPERLFQDENLPLMDDCDSATLSHRLDSVGMKA